MNTNVLATVANLSDEALLARLEALAGRAREATAELIAHLSELQIRKADRGEGPGSLFEYCTRVLRLSEAASFNRIAAASAARKFPLILDLLADGAINLTIVRVLAPHLTVDNHDEALRAAIGRTKQEVEEIRARLAPRADVAPSVRKLPMPRPTPAPTAVALPVDASSEDSAAPVPKPPARALGQPSTSAHRPIVQPLSPERYRVQFTIGKETQEKLRRLQDLMRREIPDGDPGAIFDRALTLLLKEAEKKKFSATERPRPPKAPRPGSRDVPADVERAVWERDGGQCAFVGRKGRCAQRSFLEFHHIDPHANGGKPTVENISLRCRAHNVYESELIFGRFDPSVVRESEATYEADGQGSSETCPGTGSDHDEKTMARFVGMEA
jgi:5-methylcytosine-specific restriction endonuclease McrA